MVTFEEWGEPQEYKLYAIRYDGYYVARLTIDTRPQFNNIIIFDNKKVFPVKMVSEIYTAIRQEFGEMEIRIAAS